MFNRPFIFSMAKMYTRKYAGKDSFLFGGIYRVVDRTADAYEVERTSQAEEFIRRLVIRARTFRTEPFESIWRLTSTSVKCSNSGASVQFEGGDITLVFRRTLYIAFLLILVRPPLRALASSIDGGVYGLSLKEAVSP